MVRGDQPPVERMTLVWHDWFATTASDIPQRFMIEQNATLRRCALGSFVDLARELTTDPAMLLFLNGSTTPAGARTKTTAASSWSSSRSAPTAGRPRRPTSASSRAP